MVAANDAGPSYTLNFNDAVQIWLRYWQGEYQNRIAASFDVNPARVNEVLKGKRLPGSEAVAREIWRRGQAA